MKTTHLRPIRPAATRARQGAPAPSPRPPAPARLPVSFRGDVVDAHTLEPLAGARAALAEPLDLLGRLAPPAPSRRRNGLSDARGRFELAAPADRAFFLLVHHPGYLPELVELAAGAREARVLLSRPSSIHGRLLDAEGAPVAGARVRALCPDAGDAAGSVTAPDGTFHLDGLRPGRWLVEPEGAPAEGLAAAAVDLPGGGSTLLVLSPRRCAPDRVC
ncbi:MAG TPA: carboxypeptidase-like regulatory domain-containing protein [Anaeromyxobacteraceae bacterium]|nr:carboxypeptidase-like regulatory domain-containing protein [Anaeromyxobacteraceae bacterium]